MTRHKRQQELVKNAAILESPIRSVAPFSGTIEDSPAPVRLLNQLLTWVSTPARPSEEKEQEKEKERDNEQEKEQVQEATPPEDVRLALTYSPPKEQQDNNSSPARQEVACFPCNICDNVFFNEDNLNSHVKGHTVVPPPRSEVCPLTASGRLLLLTPTFGSKHLKFQEALNNDHIEVFDDSSDEEDNDGQQTCKVCKKTVKNVPDLQDHILAKHGSQSKSVLELLKLHQQLLNTILAGQSTQLERVNAIALKQTCIIDDIKQIKNISSSSSSSPSLSSFQASVEEPAARAVTAAPSYSQVAGQQQERVQRQAAPAPQPRRNRRRNKLLIAGDSLLANHHRDMIKEATKDEVIEVQEVKCCAAVYSEAPEIKFRRKNFTDIVSAELEDNNFTAVLMQSSSVELTNLKGKGASPDLLKQTALVAAQNMFSVATAAATNPTVETVILAQAPPRIDEMAEHAEFGNQELDRLWQEAEPALKQKISIGRHKYLTSACPCSDTACQQYPGPKGGLEASRYGTRDTHGSAYDGVHFRGTSGKISNTRSLIDMLSSVGLATPLPRTSDLEADLTGQGRAQGWGQGQGQGWQQQGRRKAGRPKGQRRSEPFELALRNRFQGNWGRPSPWRRA